MGDVTTPLNTSKLRKPHLLERVRQKFKGMYGSVPLLLTAEYRDHGSKFFSEGVGWGGDRLGSCCIPCPCCHVSTEMREGQDVAHSGYLGGWQGRHLVNISPLHSYPTHTAVPNRPPCSLSTACSTPFPSGVGIMPTGPQAGLLVSTLCSQVSLAAASKCVHQAQ